MVDASAVCGYQLIVGAVFPEHTIGQSNDLALRISWQGITQQCFRVFIGAVTVHKEESPVFVKRLTALHIAIAGFVSADVPLPCDIVSNHDIQLGQSPLFDHGFDFVSGKIEGIRMGAQGQIYIQAVMFAPPN